MRKILNGLDRQGERGKRTLPVEIVQRGLDPVGDEQPEIRPGQNQWRPHAYNQLVEAVGALPRNPYLRPSVCDRQVRFSLGLESERQSEQQILASVSRAFALTDFYAAASADERDRVDAIRRNKKIVEKAMQLLTESTPLLCRRGGETFAWEQEGPIAELLDAHSQLAIQTKPATFETIEEMRSPIAVGLAALNELLVLSEGRGMYAPENLDSDRFRRFFVVCLAEIFTAHTGELPYFDATPRVKNPGWLNFLEASLEVVGFSTQGLDDLLRDLKRGGARTRNTKNSSWEDNGTRWDDFERGSRLAEVLEVLRERLEMTPSSSRYSLEGGNLPSSGWMLDVSDQSRPAMVDQAYPHLMSNDEAGPV